jgi:phospholipase C
VRIGRSIAVLVLAAAGLVVATPVSGAATAVPKPDHVVIVVLENRAYGGSVGNASTPYITSLANSGANFTNVPASSNLRYTRFPTDYSTLPSVSFVIPNLCNDMHDCSIATGDTWMKNNLDAYANWAKTHNSLLITTFDEDDHSAGNQITTIFTGQHVKQGPYTERIAHYSVLRTLEDAYGLACTGSACSASAITDVWQ